jgi:hypothetical protein
MKKVLALLHVVIAASLIMMIGGCGHESPPAGKILTSSIFPKINTDNRQSLGNDWFYFETKTPDGVTHSLLLHQTFREGGDYVTETLVELRSDGSKNK